jgi:hypothetical protein
MTQEQIRKARSFGNAGGGSAGTTTEGNVILARGLNDENGKHHGVGVVDVEHEAGDQSEKQPLRERTRRARAMPIPEEEGNGKSGLGVGPGGIEVHVNGKRAGPPDSDGGEKRPAFVDVVAGETEGEEEAEKTIDGSGEGHGDAIGSGKTVGSDGGAQGAGEQDAGVSDEEKRHPENGGADGEVVVKMAGGSAKFGARLVVFVETWGAESFVGVAVVFGEIEVVLDQRSADEGVVADTVTADPGIEERESEQKEEEKQALGFAGARGGRRAEVLLIHKRSTRRKPSLFPAATMAGSITMQNECPKSEEGT